MEATFEPLYVMVGNDIVNNIDQLGLYWIPPPKSLWESSGRHFKIIQPENTPCDSCVTPKATLKVTNKSIRNPKGYIFSAQAKASGIAENEGVISIDYAWWTCERANAVGGGVVDGFFKNGLNKNLDFLTTTGKQVTYGVSVYFAITYCDPNTKTLKREEVRVATGGIGYKKLSFGYYGSIWTRPSPDIEKWVGPRCKSK